APTKVPSPFPPPFVAEVDALCNRTAKMAESPTPRYLIERLLLDTSGYLAAANLPGIDEELLAEVKAARGRLAAAGCPVPAVESIARYSWAAQMLDGVITRPTQRRHTLSDRIDRVLTHRLWGTLVFVI